MKDRTKAGDTIKFNPRKARFDKSKISVDFPTLALNIRNSINFYEKNSTSLLSINFRDISQLSPEITSLNTIEQTKPPNSAKGTYFSNSIPLGKLY